MSRPFCIFFSPCGKFLSLYGSIFVYGEPYFLCGGPFSLCEVVFFCHYFFFFFFFLE